MANSYDIELALLMGPGGDDSWTREQLERAWKVHRRFLMEHAQHPGGRIFRPWAYWTIELGLPEEPDDEHAIELLRERGELVPWEVEELDRLSRL